MSDTLKPMTEPEFRTMMARCFPFSEVAIHHLEIIEVAKMHGYILKSELQQKVEEAEEKYKAWFKREQLSNEFDCYLITGLYDVIQLLKQSHPEFKK